MKKICNLFFLLFSIISVYGQHWKFTRYEVFVGLGTTNYFGDIGGTSLLKNNWFGLRDYNILTTRPGLTFGARYKLTQQSAVRLNFIPIMLGGNDKYGDNAYRNYFFNTYGVEHSLQFEYALVLEEPRRRSYLFYQRGLLTTYSRLGFYVFGGFGGMSYYANIKRKPSDYNPKADFYKPGFHYSGALLAGLMTKMNYSNFYAFSAEIGFRYMLNDYADGLSTKYSKFNDVYYFANVSFIFRLKTTRKGYPVILDKFIKKIF